MTVLLTADWTPFGKDDYFRKFEVYSMEWPPGVDLDSLSLTSTCYGGPIALVRDRNKIVKVQGSGKPTITICNSSGLLISSFLWSSGQIIQLGWSLTLDLLCVIEDGHVLIYDIFSNYQHAFNMGQEAIDTKILDAKIFYTPKGTGIAVLTASFNIFLVNNFKEPRTRKLPDIPGISTPPTSWVVLPEDRQSSVICARGKEVYFLSEQEQHAVPKLVDLGDESCSVISMAASLNYTCLAMLTDRGKLWIGKSDLSICYRLYDLRNTSPPTQLVWCATDAVIINWGTQLDVIGIKEECIKYNYDETVFIVPEVDCVRAITYMTMDIIQKVPQVVRDIFRINSKVPGSYLLEASKQFQKKSHRSNEYLHLVKDKLFTAVLQCVEAAGHEFRPETQKLLIKAAQFGKIYLDECSPENYVTMCRVLRCLNAVRHPKIGIPITHTQLYLLTVQGLIELLMIRQRHFLALHLASFLRMPESSDVIRFHWACYKVKHSKHTNEQIAKEISEKIGQSKGVSFTKIAKEAADCGKNELAIKIIEYEPRANLQVPLLLKLGEDRTALVKAINSGNTDLVYTVLLQMKENIDLGKFQMIIRGLPLAQALYLKYCKLHNKDMLKDVYTQEDDHKSQAICYIRESYDPKNRGMRDASLVAAQESYKRAKHDLHASFCEDQLKLLKYQRSLEDKFRRDFVGKSLHETVKQLLTIEEVKLADKLRSEYKVPDRRYWWLRIQVLSELEEWMELEKFAKSKKSPIGYEPFVDIYLKHDKPLEAQKYLPKVRDEFKVKYYTKAGFLEEAAKIAFEQKNIDALKYVAESKCDQELSEHIAYYIWQLTK